MFFSYTTAIHGLIAQLNRYRYGCLGFLTAAILITFSLANNVYAQDNYPAFQDPYVNDYGQVLATEDEVSLRSKLEQFRHQTGVQAVLLTINSVADYGFASTSIEPFATQVFNNWGIGDAVRDDGILVLVAPGDRKVRIELGSGYETRDDQIAQGIIDDTMLPKFRQGEISLGTVAGVNAVIKQFHPAILERSKSPLAKILRISHWFNPFNLAQAYIRGFTPELGWLSLFFGVPAAVGLFAQWQRYRTRFCPQCTTAMVRLDKGADAPYLEPGQVVEKKIQSVDYDVWLCQSCRHHTPIEYASRSHWRHWYKTCPKCHYKTLESHQRVLTASTYTSTGLAELTESCLFCDHQHTNIRTLPKQVRSSSSSDSSSSSSSSYSPSPSSDSYGGGGSSSGGGASGSW